MVTETLDLVFRAIETIGFLSLIVALYEVRKGNDQRFREVLSGYLRSMQDTLRLRFETKVDEMGYRNCLLIFDQCIFSILNRKNKINKNEMTDELSRLSTTLYFGELDAIKEKVEWFKRELFR